MEITVTKLEAARRQLKTAIELWFADGDPVSVHTLAHASHEVLHRIYRNRGLKDLLFDSTLIKDEHRAEFSISIKESANFFKHAKNEGETDISIFRTQRNDLYLLMSVIAIDRMKETRSDVEAAFIFWHFLHAPKWFPEDVAQNNIPIDRLAELKKLSRRDLLQAFLEGLAEKRRLGYDINGDRT